MDTEFYDLYFTPLSPVHMGTGDDYEPTNYVIDDGVLYEFDTFEVMQTLGQQQKQKLSQILSTRANQDTLRSIQRFFYDEKGSAKAGSRRQVKVNPSIEAYYEQRIGKVAQHESTGARVNNKLEIKRSAWNPISSLNYLPGSGIKGSVRTALLNRENKGRKQKRDRKENNQFQEELLGGKFESDPMRLISVSDAQTASDHVLSEIVFELNKKKLPVKNKQGEAVESMASKGDLALLLECISPFQYRAMQSKLAVQNVPLRDNKVPSLQYQLHDIAEACNKFYLPLLTKEVELLTGRGFLQSGWKQKLDELLQSDDIKQNRAFVIRAGRHSGAEAITIDGARSIKIMKGKKAPLYEEEATTIWLASQERQNQRDMLPFGWMLVETAVTGQKPATTFPAIQSNEAEEWFAALEEKLQHDREQMNLLVAQEKERERQRIKAEQEQLEKERREQECLENMSDLEKRVYELEQTPDGQPAIALMHAIENGEWENENDISQVAIRIRELLQEKGDWTPDFAGSNKQKLKKKQRSLKIQAWIKE